MATIQKHKNKNGTFSYRVLIRRVNIPVFCCTFYRLKDAKNWVLENEKKYIKNHEKYEGFAEKHRLSLQRKRSK